MSIVVQGATAARVARSSTHRVTSYSSQAKLTLA
jgi:hypothetical protein